MITATEYPTNGNVGLKIIHLVNPVIMPSSSDLYVAQPITFESMRRARLEEDGAEVILAAAVYPEDRDLVPDYFDRIYSLDRSILDVKEMQKPRKLPLISDILGTVGSEAYDVLIYTNVDIALMPSFYKAVSHRFRKGTDAFIINRRTIGTEFTDIQDLEMMYAQAGEIHPGLDCFVMSKEVVDRMYSTQVVIGMDYVGKVMRVNMEALAKDFKVFEHDHLTFHLGDDRAWKNPELDDYRQHNREALRSVLDHYMRRLEGEAEHPALPTLKRYLSRIFSVGEEHQKLETEYSIPSEESLMNRWKARLKGVLRSKD